MNTICIAAYKYEELSEKAKETVKHWLNEYATPWDDDSEYWLEELAALGYDDIDFQYSGFYSQGDGASIACTVNVQQFIKRNKLGNKYRSLLYWLKEVFDDGGGIKVVREHWGHYVHEKLLRADGSDLWHDLACYDAPERLEAQVVELEAMILEEVQEWSHKIYKALQEEYEYHFTDEYMIDMCEANEYLFDEYGNPIHHMVISEPATVEAVSA